MVLSSYSKINLSLTINSKRKNNMHDIQSFFCLIDLKDKIKLSKIKGKKDKIFFKGPFSKFVNKSNNSIVKLLKFLRKSKLIENHYSVTIIKNIPVFAGLGGGTGNAAFIMKHLLKKKLNNNLISKVQTKIGSDLRLFFYRLGYLKNLSTIIDLDRKYKLYFLLAQPKVRCSTKEIYSKVREFSKKKVLKKQLIQNKNNFINYLSDKCDNDLQSIVEKKYPIIKLLLKDIKNQKGCNLSRMTGSGSVCYGLFKDQITAKKALYNLKNKYPKIWLSLAKTV